MINAFGVEVGNPLDAFFIASCKMAIKEGLSQVVRHLEHDTSRVDIVLNDIANYLECTKSITQAEKEGFELLVRKHKLIHNLDGRLRLRAAKIVRQITPYIIGPRILDFGCGDGRVGASLAALGFDVTLYDIINYKAPEVGEKFILGMEGQAPEFRGTFHTALILTVLHHCNDPRTLLHNLRHLDIERVIIIESVFDVSEPGLDDERSASLEELFLKLSSKDQLFFISFFDWFYNRVLHVDVAVPLNFCQLARWPTELESCGWKVSLTKNLGIDQPLVPEFHLLLVAERN